MPRPLRIALAQLESSPHLERNLKNLRDTVAQSKAEKAQLVIFPEFFVQGVLADSPEKVFSDGSARDDLAALAKEHDIDICIGTLVESHDQHSEAANAREKKPFNVSYYFDRHGKTLGTYHKRNLWHPEKDYLHPGQGDHTVFDTEYARCGILVCWDLAWPEAFRALFLQGVEVVIVPSYWVGDDITDAGAKHDPDLTGEKSWLDALVITRAYENECAVIYVNCGGPKEKGFLGRSAVALPFKGCVGRTSGCEEEVKIVDIDLDVLKDAKDVYQMKRDYKKGMAEGGFSGATDA